jgi:inhibitor of cysteine peptidase
LRIVFAAKENNAMSIRKAPLRISLIVCATLAACAVPGSDLMKLTAKDAGSIVHVKQGDTVEISLECNPTTGYTWEVAPGGNEVLEPWGEAEFKPETSALGSGGIMTLRFKAAQAGASDLKLVYHRTFEPDVTPIQTFQVTVVVD